MILINKVTPFANEAYQKDLIECLINNSDISFISNIVIFYNNTNIVLPKNNKVKLVIKNGYTDREIIEYCKRIYNDDVFIFSNPFIKFNNSLINLETPVDKTIKIDDGCYIFNKNTELEMGDNIDSILRINTSNNKILIERKNLLIKNEDNIIPEKRQPNISRSLLEKNVRRKESYLNKRRKELSNETNIKLDIIIVSVNYNDFLSITLKSTTKVSNVTVVTSKNDIICQELCKKFGANCIITERMYEDGAIFNKGKAINEGIKSLKNPEWILLLDADIYLQDDFLEVLEKTNLIHQNLIVCKRLILDSYELFLDFLNNKDVGRLERAKGFGYFQMFNIKKFQKKSNIFPENSNDAAWSDIIFRDTFNKNETELNTTVLHLGQTCQNWEGRKTKRFIENELFLNETEQSFDINKYFDKIYCINLQNKKDRWERVEKLFNENLIEVERFEAINGLTISDEEFNNILNKYNPNRLTGESASLNGLIENKNSLACLLSHIELIKTAKINNYKRILIFEDDITFSKDFTESIKKISKIDWSIVYLGASQFNWSGIEEKDCFYLCKNTLGTFAYAIESSIYDDVINLLETKRKSVDNLLSEIQSNNYGKCYTFYPNIVISDVESSDIRESKNIITYSNLVRWNLSNFNIIKKKKILLLPDVKDWAFDNIAKSVVKYNPYPDKIEYTIKYARDIHQKRDNVISDEWDLIFVMWEAERCIPDGDNVIRGCYSAFWLENSYFSEEKISEFFKASRGGVFVNNYLKNSICKFLPQDYPQTIIHDSADEEKFYHIDNVKENEFTAIFVGNTNRKVKNYEDIVEICNKSDIKLITCTNVNNDDLVNYYNKADICINFSTSEGGPQTFLEAGLCEVPMLIRNDNELSKLIPCFTGESKEDFIKIINNLKKNRTECKEVGKKAREVVLENFTYKKTANKFANFFLNVLSKEKSNLFTNSSKDLSDYLTVFIIRCGQNPNYEDCLKSLLNQTVKFNLIEIKDIAPMSKAFQKMIDDCKTDYYIQVDEDMILYEDTIEKIYDRLIKTEENISTVAHMLNDVHLDFDIYGIKGYKHTILKKYPYNLEIISCEVEQMSRLQNDGFETLMCPEVVGQHSPKWTEQLIYERYFDLMEKWKVFKYNWLDELPAKLMEIFKSDPSDINLFALMGAMTSISNESPLRNREKNFLIKDNNFERIENLVSKKEFKFITNNNKPISPEILIKNYVKK
jgi:GR25 family glycosyltransferase involved in LPS biosynthesis